MIIKMVFGSHLYGTNGPASDRDYKAVYLPKLDDLILQRVRRNMKESTRAGGERKNTADDVETEMFSLHEFIRLACEGQTLALDMLHAPPWFWVPPAGVRCIEYVTWQRIVKERHRFYTKSLHAFVGYARKQVAKYGIKGSRLSDLKYVIGYLSGIKDKEARLESEWKNLPVGEHVRFAKVETGRQFPEQEFYEVLGRQLGRRVTIKHALNCLKSIEHQYGERARAAERSEGVDWKAVSHAHRAADQCMELLKHGTITMPRPNAAWLRGVKEGRYGYPHLAELLEKKMVDLEGLQAKSTLPEKVDREYWDNFILDIYKDSK